MQKVFAGIDVGGTRIKVGLADTSGKLLLYEILDTAKSYESQQFLDRVVDKIRALANSGASDVVAAGIGCPGRIDSSLGKVVWLRSKLEFLEGLDLGHELSMRLGCPVACDNDVNTILAGEMRFGAAMGHKSVIAVTLGTGIGGAIAVEGHLVRGSNWAAGHFGYMSLNPKGPKHVCGNTGVAEEFASYSGVIREVRRALECGQESALTELLAGGKELGLRELFDCQQDGDLLASLLVDRLILDLGAMIANLIYALDPELIVVGGGIVSHRPAVLDAIRREVGTRVDFLQPRMPEVRPMALGDAAGVLGGVALAMDLEMQTKKVEEYSV